jgi:long-chain fatty acid transport protein
MKKQFLLIASLVFIASAAFGGGIVTNTNQSAYWVRTLVRDAAIGPDAVYFNPAGLTKLEDGFHFSLNTQTILQNKDVTRDYDLLIPNPKTFEGDVLAPVFPGFYATWKKSKIAVSFGFNPIGGGGGAEYEKGLPSFESQLTSLVPLLQQLGGLADGALSAAPPNGYGFDPNFKNVTGYSADIYFKGTSVFFGYQLGLTYDISKVFSVYLGGRLVTAKNTYEGHINDIQIQASPTVPPVPLYDLPPGSYTPGDYVYGISEATGIKGSAYEATFKGVSAMLDVQTADRAVDAEETGTGFAPIIGVNIAPNEKINIGLKYEFKTKMDLTTEIIDDKDGGLFNQDSTVHSDMPAMLSVGIEYKVLPKLTASAGFHYYWDKSANYGKTLDAEPTEPVGNDEVIDDNFFEFALGLEYAITEKLLISAGYLHANTGVSEDYQSDLSYSLTSNTLGGGLGYKITEKIMVNLGGAYVTYQEGTKTVGDPDAGGYTDTLYKDSLFFGLGVDLRF